MVEVECMMELDRADGEFLVTLSGKAYTEGGGVVVEDIAATDEQGRVVELEAKELDVANSLLAGAYWDLDDDPRGDDWRDE